MVTKYATISFSNRTNEDKMKYSFLLVNLFFLSLTALKAQHEGHNINTGDRKSSQQRGVRRIGPIVEYHLYVNDTTVNYTGRKRKALAINSQIPAPTLRFTEGDSAVIHVHNKLKGEVSIHWHGVLLPNEEDGVHALNTPPIHEGSTHTFRFRIIQNGTLWYHSHTGFQEQEGLYGPLVFYPAVPERESGKNEEVLQISDWRDESGKSVMRSLKRRNEWYAIQKKGVQSWGEAIVKGHFGDKVQMEWTRMPGADVSDVYYPVHLMQGQPVQTFSKYKKGDSVLLRVVNGSAATYYWLQYSGGKMRVVASDGTNVKPVDVDKVLIATAETYGIMIKIPDDGQYEFRATAQDITTSASAFFGSGPQVRAKDIPKLDYMVLMREMNQMTWMMKGMGMKMKMGLYMKMNMDNMQGMNMSGMRGGMQGMDHGNMDMNDTNMNNMDHKGMDTTGAKIDMDHMDHGNMSGMDTTTQSRDTADMNGMDHSNMPGMQKQPAKKKAPPSATKKATKAPVKKTATKKPPIRIPTQKKPAVNKPAPKKKDAMEGMDHSKHGGMSYAPAKRWNLNPQVISGLFLQHNDTVPNKEEQGSMQGHAMHNMGNMKMDTVPKKMEPVMNHQNMQMPALKGNNMSGMQHGNMNMGGMQGGKQKSTINQRDTSRSYMLQTMMTPMPMTGFDFPPGNGNDVVLGYDMLASDSGSTTLPQGRPWREIEITLSGNMLRYVWSINGKTLSQQDTKIMIRKGENVRVIFTNATMMEHPMHLHGHFFRVINNQGANAPMKHTFNINAMHTQVIEFTATEEKDWFLHCHTLYHMNSGMATIFSYEGTVSQVQQAHPKEFRQFLREHGSRYYPWSNAAFHSQGTFGTVVLSGAKLQLDQDWRWDYKKSYELETRLQYFLDKRQYFSAFAGFEYERVNVKNGKIQPKMEQEKVAVAGLQYLLPFFISVEGRVDHKGKFRFEAQREDLPLTTRTRLDLRWNTDKEYGVEARYIIAKYLAVSANYDSDYGWGAGLSIVY